VRYDVLTLGRYLEIGELCFLCIGPQKLRNCSAGVLAENYNSLILRLTDGRGGGSVLLTGDTSASILGNCPGIEGTAVLKNPHHNGRLPVKLLRRIKPQTVVVCNGKPPAKAYIRNIHSVSANLFTAGARGDGRVTARFKDGTCHIKTTK
jgi:beta-lactamase superfamily II metal-dependent hydrolase